MAIHEDSWNPSGHPFQYRRAYAESLEDMLTSRSEGTSRRTHRDVRHEMAERFVISVRKGSSGYSSDDIYPSITSAIVERVKVTSQR